MYLYTVQVWSFSESKSSFHSPCSHMFPNIIWHWVFITRAWNEISQSWLLEINMWAPITLDITMKYDWEKSVSMPDKYSQIATSHRPLILTCQLQKLPHGATDWARQYKPSPTSSILSQTHVSSIFHCSSVYLLTSIVYLTLFFSSCVAVESRKPQLVTLSSMTLCATLLTLMQYLFFSSSLYPLAFLFYI